MTSYRLAKVAVVAAAIAVGSLVLPSRAEAGSGPFWQFSSPHKCEFHTPGVDIGDPIDAVVGETWYTHDDVTVNTAGSSWPFRRAYAALEGFRHCDTQDNCSDIRIPTPFGDASESVDDYTSGNSAWRHGFYSYVQQTIDPYDLSNLLGGFIVLDPESGSYDEYRRDLALCAANICELRPRYITPGNDAGPRNSSQYTDNKLIYDGNVDQFIYVTRGTTYLYKDKNANYYQGANYRNAYFLTMVTRANGSIAAIAYTTPSLNCVRIDTATPTTAAPFIDTITFDVPGVASDNVKLRFNWIKPAGNADAGNPGVCAIGSINLESGSSSKTVATYTYQPRGYYGHYSQVLLTYSQPAGNNVDAATNLSTNDQAEGYTYTNNGAAGISVAITRNGESQTHQYVPPGYSNPGATATYAGHSNYVERYDKDGGTKEPVQGGSDDGMEKTGIQMTRSLRDQAAHKGNGSGALATTKRWLFYRSGVRTASGVGPIFHEAYDDCTADTLDCVDKTATGNYIHDLYFDDRTGNTVIGVSGSCTTGAHRRATKKLNGFWEVNYVCSDNASAPGQPELRATIRGANDYNGTAAGSNESAPEITQFSYIYGSNHQQLLRDTTTVSSFNSYGPAVVAHNVYESDTGQGGPSTRLAAIQKTGITTTLLYGNQRTLETYWYDFGDSLGRTATEGHRVSGASAPYQVTAFTYYPADYYDPQRRNRLQFTTRYPSGSQGTGIALTRTVAFYDDSGHPVLFTDENSTGTLLAYNGENVTREWVTSGSNHSTTDTTYYMDKPVAVHGPLGDYAVACWANPNGLWSNCNGVSGEEARRVKWVKHVDTFNPLAPDYTVAWRQKEQFEYWPDDDTVKSHTYYVCNKSSGATCADSEQSSYVVRVVNTEANPDRLVSWIGWGDYSGTAPYATFARAQIFSLDGARLLTAVGLPYNQPASGFGRCAGSNAPYCKQLAYGATDRLKEILETLADGTQIRTCVFHDAHGNIARVQGPYARTTPCTLDYGTAMDYYGYDDFDRLQFASTMGMGDASNNAYAYNYDYDAMGNRVSKFVTALPSPTPPYSGNLESFTYDYIGRKTSAWVGTTTTPQTTELYANYYDTNNAPPSCMSLTQAQTMTRLSSSWSPPGMTWYSYDYLGNIAGEYRLRGCQPDGTNCSACTGADRRLDTVYDRDPNNGRLMHLKYPHTREVYYQYYTEAARSAQIQAVWIDNSASTQNCPWPTGQTTKKCDKIIDNIQWRDGEPASYELWGGLLSKQGAVEYRLQTTPAHTGRLDGIYVTKTSGTNVYKRTYSWTADQITSQTTTAINVPNSVTESFSYDRLLRLTSTGGNIARTYNLDARGNRTSVVDNSFTETYTPTSYPANVIDQVQDVSWSSEGSQAGDRAYTYDNLGRATERREAGINWSSVAAKAAPIEFDYNVPTTSSPAFESIRRAGVGRTPTWYTYIYDSRNRRLQKEYPIFATYQNMFDEYVYWFNEKRMLEDRGLHTLAAQATSYPIDEYIWLGSKPVAVFRRQLGSTYLPVTGTPDCTRNDRTAACGLFFLVTDATGMPLATLDTSARLSGATMESDPFGAPNRRAFVRNSVHPYTATTPLIGAVTTLPTVNSGTTEEFKVRFHVLDMKKCGTTVYDYGWLTDNASPTPHQMGPQFSGSDAGPVWSDWLAPQTNLQVGLALFKGTDSLNRKLKSDGSCASVGWCLVHPSLCTSWSGVSTEAIEYRVRETAASAFWVPMRFQGQYLDDETELLENWNRFYDPPSGKYLEPDPVLAEHPEAIAEAAKRGIQINPYAYAGNNPINKIDLDGRQTGPEDAALFFFGMSEVLIDAAIALSTAAAVGCAISGTCADLVEDLMRKIQEATKEKTKEGVDVCPPKKDCYPQYLKDTAECGSLYTDDVEYEACMAQAWKNYIRCLNGLPWQPMRR